MDFKTALLGQHEIGVWIASLLWSFIGALIVKVKFLPKNLSWKEFKFSKWVDENIIDFFKSILYATGLLRLGDVAIQVTEYLMKDKIPFQIEDFVIFVALVTAVIQYKLHNNKK